MSTQSRFRKWFKCWKSDYANGQDEACLSLPSESKVAVASLPAMSLTEAVLAIMLALMLLAGLAQYRGGSNDDIRAKNTAESMQSFSHIAAQYLISNREEIRTAIENSGATGQAAANEHCRVGANPSTGAGGVVAVSRTLTTSIQRTTCAVDIDWLKYKRILPPGYAGTNPYGQKMVAIYRLVYANYDNKPSPSVSDFTTRGDFEVLIVAAEQNTAANAQKIKNAPKLKPTEIITAADLMGGNGGIIPDGSVGNCQYQYNSNLRPQSRADVCGVGGGWKLNMNNFINN